MSVVLPGPIASYFAADKSGEEAVAECFAQDAVVKDDGYIYRGIADIRGWKAASSSKYKYISEPISCESKDGITVVTGRVTGNFPGSPIDLRYLFKLDGDRIASLEIVP